MANDTRAWDIVKWIGGLAVVFASALFVGMLMIGDVKAKVAANQTAIKSVGDTIDDVRERVIRIENILIGDSHETTDSTFTTSRVYDRVRPAGWAGDNPLCGEGVND